MSGKQYVVDMVRIIDAKSTYILRSEMVATGTLVIWAFLHLLSCGVSCLQELTALTKVKRFSVASMFLSRKDKESKRLKYCMKINKNWSEDQSGSHI